MARTLRKPGSGRKPGRMIYVCPHCHYCVARELNKKHARQCFFGDAPAACWGCGGVFPCKTWKCAFKYPKPIELPEHLHSQAQSPPWLPAHYPMKVVARYTGEIRDWVNANMPLDQWYSGSKRRDRVEGEPDAEEDE